MHNRSIILVTTLLLSTAVGVLSLSGCGQKGGLVLPNDPDFKQRATLPEIIKRQLPNPMPAATPASDSASSPSDH